MPGWPLWRSFQHAFAGIWYVIRTQRNAKIHLAIASFVVVLSLFLGLPPAQWALLVLTIALVIAAEILNTVIESLADLVSPDFHPLAKIAKDAAAGAVLVLAIGSVLVGLLILGPPLWRWCGLG